MKYYGIYYIYYIFALTICCTCKLYMGVKSRRGKKSGGKKTGGKKSGGKKTGGKKLYTQHLHQCYGKIVVELVKPCQ